MSDFPCRQLSIVIPAFNEAATISSTLETIRAFCSARLDDWEVIVVDDGSADDTAEKVTAHTDDHIRLLRNEPNQGKGFAVRRGMLEARCDPVMFTDADLSAPVTEATRLAEAIADGADVAIASRRLDPSTSVRRTPLRRLMAFVFRLLVQTIVIRGFNDTQCGFKMFRREAAQTVFSRQRLTGWGFDVEALHIARRHQLRTAEVPVSWSESSVTRVRWHTPLTVTLDLLCIRWNSILRRYR